MQEQIIIRLVEERDADDLWENIFSRNTPTEVKARIEWYRTAFAEGKRIPLVAEVDGHVIGFLCLTFEEHPLNAHICGLDDFVVNPAFQRLGIGRRLFEESKVHAKEKGRTMIKLATRGGTAAEEVYRKLGFIEYGRLPNGIVEGPPFWDEVKAYDEVLFYMSLS